MRGWRAAGIVVDVCLLLAIAAGVVARALGLPLHVADSGDEWGNTIAPFRVLYERGDPDVFIHPALYYEVTAAAYAGVFVAARAAGVLAPDASISDAFALDQRLFVNTARSVSLVAGVLTLAALYVIGRRLWSARAGLLGAALLALQPLHVFYSKTVRVDALFVLLFVVALAAIVRVLQRPSARVYVVAGLLSGLATAANYNGGLLAGWLLAAHLSRRRTSADTPWRDLGLAAASMLAAFLITNPYALLNLGTFLQNFGHQSALLLVRHPGWEDRGAAYYLDHFLAANPPFVALAALAVVAIALAGTRGERFVTSLPVAYFAIFSAIQTRDERFMLPAVAGFALLAGALPDILARMLAGWRGLGISASLTAYGLAGLALVWQAREALTIPQPTPHVVLARPDALLLDWIEDNLPPRSRVAVESGVVPLLDTLKDPSPFPLRLKQSMVRVRPGLDQTFIGLVYIGWQTYDPALITAGGIDYAIVSPRTMAYLEQQCAAHPQACAFQRELRARGRAMFETPDGYEPAVVYAIVPSPVSGEG